MVARGLVAPVRIGASFFVYGAEGLRKRSVYIAVLR